MSDPAPLDAPTLKALGSVFQEGLLQQLAALAILVDVLHGVCTATAQRDTLAEVADELLTQSKMRAG